jgi:hypothetical protein
VARGNARQSCETQTLCHAPDPRSRRAQELRAKTRRLARMMVARQGRAWSPSSCNNPGHDVRAKSIAWTCSTAWPGRALPWHRNPARMPREPGSTQPKGIVWQETLQTRLGGMGCVGQARAGGRLCDKVSERCLRRVRTRLGDTSRRVTRGGQRSRPALSCVRGTLVTELTQSGTLVTLRGLLRVPRIAESDVAFSAIGCTRRVHGDYLRCRTRHAE